MRTVYALATNSICILADPNAHDLLWLKNLHININPSEVDAFVVGIESRGFIIATALYSLHYKKPLVMIRGLPALFQKLLEQTGPARGCTVDDVGSTSKEEN